MKKSQTLSAGIKKMLSLLSFHKTGAHAAQAAYFFMLSLIPIILLLLTLVQFTPVPQSDVMAAVIRVFPASVQSLILRIVQEVYEQSGTIIPVTLLMALWSAGKGVLSVTSGLNEIYENIETRNYIYLRVRASFYTFIFILAIILSLVLSVFGNRISLFVAHYIPVLVNFVEIVIHVRTLISFVVLTLFWDLVYKFLPNRKNGSRTTMRKQLPGAVFTSCIWLLISFIFSVYLDLFQGFSIMYGSLTAIILIMLWLYFCMYIILLGGELNAYIEKTAKKV